MLKKRLIFTALIVFMFNVIAPGISGQPGMTATPQPSDEEASKKADAFLAQWDKTDMPGCSVGAVREGRLVYKRAFGMANLEYDVPNTGSTLFNIASASKPFTAMSIALLAQNGKLSLDDDIRKHLPEIPKYDQTVTIRHLLDHTSGIREYQALVFFGGRDTDNALSDKTVLNILARQKNTSFAPGTKHQYSNSNYHLLGIIISRVSGKSLRAFAEENIFKPLGMKNTMFFDNRFEVVKNRAAGYRVGQDKSVRARASLFDLVGGGGVLTTVEDLSLWDRNFYEPKIGNKELISMMTAPGKLNNGERIGYSFGLFHNRYKGLPVIKHSGNMTGYRSQTISFPEQKFTAIALCNNSAIFPSVIAEKLADIYLEAHLRPEPPAAKKAAESLPPVVALPEKDAQRYAGIYANPETGKVFKLGFKDGKLINDGLLQYETPVMPVSENRLLVVAGTDKYELIPVFNQRGSISEIKILTKSGKTNVFVPVKPPLDSPEALSEYAGTYYSDELDANYKLTLEGNNLVLQISEDLKPTLAAAYADVFTAAGGQINLVFARDDKGKITGFVFNSAADGREVKEIAFNRR